MNMPVNFIILKISKAPFQLHKMLITYLDGWYASLNYLEIFVTIFD